MVVDGDFDGNGLTDTAKFYINENKHQYGLFAFMGQPSGETTIVNLSLLKNHDLHTRLGVSKVKLGRYETACSKGYGRSYCTSTQPASITLEYDTISVITFGTSESFYYWNEGHFSPILIAD